MNRRQFLLAYVGSTLAAPSTALTLPDLIVHAKPSVVLVGSFGLLDNPQFTLLGTGFVVADGLHVVTNAHVRPPEMPGRVDRGVAVQVWTPQGQWQLRAARVVQTELGRDLALLKFEGVPVPALRLAGSEVPEGTAVALIGFPLGGALGYSHVTHRGIVSSRTAIVPPATGPNGLSPRAVKQLRQGSFEVLQLDVTAYPGNSGGPVLDIETGEVVGVLSMTVVKSTRESAIGSPTGISYAVPVRDVAALLSMQGF